jgi:hypothetical protein
MLKENPDLNPNDGLYFSKYALDFKFNGFSDELDIFEFENDIDPDHFMDENNDGKFDDEIWEE